MPKKCHIFSFFSGLGFLDLGFEATGFEVVFVNEVHAPFLAAYKHSRKMRRSPPPRYGYVEGSIEGLINSKKLDRDIEKSRKAGHLVGFIGGPPCPDFSIAGKQRGAKGDNGKLSSVYVNMILEKEPDWFLFENVKGLWGTKKHRIFYEEMKRSLEGAGYSISDKLVNAAWYGAPQDRERIIMLGFRNGTTFSEKEWKQGFLFSETVLKHSNWPTHSPFGGNPIFPKGVKKELTVGYWFSKNCVDAHPNAKNHFTPRAGLVRFNAVDEGDDSKKSYKRLHRHRYSPTVAYGNNEVHLHPWLARRLSASEALALQSLPPNFELPSKMTLSNMFKGIGNGVPFLMAKGISGMVAKKLAL